MPIAIISDIHGNRHALEAVMADLEAHPADRVYCLGDLVGYGAYPNEVVERIQAAGYPVVIGNYDDGVGYDRDECGCAYREPLDRELGQQSLEWTKARTTGPNKAYLRSLVPEIRFDEGGTRLLLVHGSPRRMNEYLFEGRPISSFRRLAQSSAADIILFGHTHVPYIKPVDGVLFVNVGSVGKPKDGDPRACYALVDPVSRGVTLRRVSYDVASAAAAVRASGLPHKFAADLELGGATAAADAPR